MTKITQYNDYSCLAACLESLLKDNQKPFDHEQFVKTNLDMFHGGKPTEGACDSVNFPEVAKRAGLGFDKITALGAVSFAPPKETILFGTFWNGDPTQKHVVRLYRSHNGKTEVMNPRTGDFDDLDPKWIVGIYKFTAA